MHVVPTVARWRIRLRNPLDDWWRRPALGLAKSGVATSRRRAKLRRRYMGIPLGEPIPRTPGKERRPVLPVGAFRPASRPKDAKLPSPTAQMARAPINSVIHLNQRWINRGLPVVGTPPPADESVLPASRCPPASAPSRALPPRNRNRLSWEQAARGSRLRSQGEGRRSADMARRFCGETLSERR